MSKRSFRDEFGSVISGDVLLINGAFLIMILYLIFNLGRNPFHCPPLQVSQKRSHAVNRSFELHRAWGLNHKT